MIYFDSDTNMVVYFDWKTVIYIMLESLINS